MLSCSCDFDSDGWYYYPPNDFKIFDHKRRKRCCSCNKLINQGTQCVEFDRYRAPVTDVEERIRGDEVNLASWFMCENCGEIYFNLSVLGYCMFLGDSMIGNLEDYWEITGFTPGHLRYDIKHRIESRRENK